MDLEALLKQFFDHDEFRPGQKETVESLLQGKHTLAMLPTGTGKSLCYQLAGYASEGAVLIVSPLLSLMQDQVEQMMMRGEKRAVAINSFLSRSEKRHVLNGLHRYKFIFISPEMLTVDFVIKRLASLHVSLFVIDEAHCISQWGYDFRPDYQRLGEIRIRLGDPLTLALTATATSEVRKDIIQSLKIAEMNQIVFSVDRPNITLAAEHVEDFRFKQERLFHYATLLKGPGIIYFSSKRLAEQMAQFLRDKGIAKVMPYHGGMEQEDRILVQQQFLLGQLDIICATSAFGMGINKDNIRFVIHYHMPIQLESYLQEIGRAGRDGKASVAILLYSSGDEQLSAQLAEKELPSGAQLHRLESWLIESGRTAPEHDLSAEEIIRFCGFTEIQWRITKKYLLDGFHAKLPLKETIARLAVFSNARAKFKSRKIEEMKKWVDGHSCRRKAILDYFSEATSLPAANCCDACGFDLHHFENTIENEIQPNKETSGTDEWRKLLAEMLLK
ncbi:ATP-dependent DNA helicase [Bacillus sp. V3-13]|uniref:RecQ family ATP-dependent DNA helicase n=1 Tax=Bacillus sp. V3-13 TaxID=2053728 RepID=UPI000C757752|nr:ATP-dependent DNA helicase RecQ [Bacillus sp. V3-13]PLR75616.1 ATP-dependent DNA helicase [Bacillus sp. V3-13]